VPTALNSLLAALLDRSRVGWLPVRVRSGPLQGAWWTLYPHSAYWRGHFEPEVQAAVAQWQPAAGACAGDLGAHFGYYTLALARAVGATGAIMALEPDAKSFRRLQRHIALNRAHQVRTFLAAASGKTGRHFLVQSHGAGSTTSHLPYQGEVVRDDTPGQWIETVALDELREKERMALPSFVKIDVEGHGATTLLGASETLAMSRPNILMSFHSPEESSGTSEILAPLGYSAYALDGSPLDWSQTMFKTVMLRPRRSKRSPTEQ